MPHLGLFKRVVRLSRRLIVARAAEDWSHVGVIKFSPVVVYDEHRPFHQHGQTLFCAEHVGRGGLIKGAKRERQIEFGVVQRPLLSNVAVKRGMGKQSFDQWLS